MPPQFFITFGSQISMSEFHQVTTDLTLPAQIPNAGTFVSCGTH